MKESTKQRIEWVDIFKAITIISVVIGHATGKYNMFIYQFHMAAFFFISGYTTKLDQRNIWETTWNKMCTIILPLISIFLIGLIFITGLDKLGYYVFLFESPFIGFYKAITQYFHMGNNYVLWMGATWFLIALFGAMIIQRSLYAFFKNKVNVGYISASLMIFLLGYALIKSGVHVQIGIFGFDLIAIAQFYFFIGIITKEEGILERLSSNKWEQVGIFLLTVIGFYYFGIINPTTVDYPSRKFGFIVTDVLSAINGILFVYLLSSFLVKLPITLKKILIFVGQNTLGILFFHFMFFKIGFTILTVLGIVPISYLKNFIPTVEIGSRFWLLFVISSITLSILLWKLMMLIKPLRIMLGQESKVYYEVYRKLRVLTLFQKISKIKLTVDIAKLQKLCTKVKVEIINNKRISLIVVSLSVLAFAPMMIQGIMCNDELQAHFSRMQGMKALLMKGFENELRQGRPMRILAAIQHALSFTSNNIYIYRSFQMLFIFVNIVLFGYFLYLIFRNKKFALFTAVSILLFLPITFEHTLPNAFVGLVSFPMTFLLLALITYNFYVENKRLGLLICSMGLFFIAMMGYEFVVTFVLLFPIIYWAKMPAQKWNIFNLIKGSIVPCAVGILYIVLMLGFQKVFSVSYAGAKMGFVSLKSSVDIIWTLFNSSLPGYYLFNKKYEYLYNLYANPTSYFDLFNIRILLLLGMFLFLLRLLLPHGNDKNKNKYMPNIAIFIGLAYMLIPAMPNAVTQMYQGNVTSSNFTGLPVSYFLYFASVFTICYIIWKITDKLKGKYSVMIISCIICLYCLPIQAMNDTFSEEQSRNYKRMVSIEQLFDTSTVKNMNNQSIYAPNLYRQQNALAIHNEYWSQFAQSKGLKIDVTNGEKKSDEPFTIYYQNDDYFVICGGNEVVVLSQMRLSGNHPIQISDTKYDLGVFENEYSDGGFYRYNFIKVKDGTALINNKTEEVPFKNMSIDAGKTLKTAKILKGYFSDGWIEKSCEFKIQAGKDGKVILNGYFPNEITGNETGTIYIDGERNLFKIEQASFTLELPAKAENVVTVKIENDFDYQAAATDTRKVSFILSDAQGK